MKETQNYPLELEYRITSVDYNLGLGHSKLNKVPKGVEQTNKVLGLV